MPLEIQFIQASTHITVIQGSRIVNGHAPVPLSSDFWEWRMGVCISDKAPLLVLLSPKSENPCSGLPPHP